ncbi:unnamed protein product [Phaeothamnion confervicola]
MVSGEFLPPLRSLVIRYCNWGGSSRNIPEFLRTRAVDLAKLMPHAEISTEIRRGRHPCLVATYGNGRTKVICIKNESVDAIDDWCTRLRQESGRKVLKLDRPVISNAPTVQGVWDPSVPYHSMRFMLEHHRVAAPAPTAGATAAAGGAEAAAPAPAGSPA